MSETKRPKLGVTKITSRVGTIEFKFEIRDGSKVFINESRVTFF